MKIYTVLQLDSGVEIRIGDRVYAKGIDKPSFTGFVKNITNFLPYIDEDLEGTITFTTDSKETRLLSIREIEVIDLIERID